MRSIIGLIGNICFCFICVFLLGIIVHYTPDKLWAARWGFILGCFISGLFIK